MTMFKWQFFNCPHISFVRTKAEQFPPKRKEGELKWPGAPRLCMMGSMGPDLPDYDGSMWPGPPRLWGKYGAMSPRLWWEVWGTPWLYQSGQEPPRGNDFPRRLDHLTNQIHFIHNIATKDTVEDAWRIKWVWENVSIALSAKMVAHIVCFQFVILWLWIVAMVKHQKEA